MKLHYFILLFILSSCHETNTLFLDKKVSVLDDSLYFEKSSLVFHFIGRTGKKTAPRIYKKRGGHIFWKMPLAMSNGAIFAYEEILFFCKKDTSSQYKFDRSKYSFDVSPAYHFNNYEVNIKKVSDNQYISTIHTNFDVGYKREIYYYDSPFIFQKMIFEVKSFNKNFKYVFK